MSTDGAEHSSLVPETRPAGEDSPAWYVVVVPEFEPCRVERFDDEYAAADFLRGLVGRSVWCFVFRGWRAFLTRGPLRVLRLPDGRRLPLYSIEELAGEDDEQGYLGDPEKQRPLMPAETVSEETESSDDGERSEIDS